jgi:hypothetical protein
MSKNYYQKLIKLYPKAFQKQFGHEILLDYLASENEKRKTGNSMFSIRTRALLDSIASSTKEHFKAKTASSLAVDAIWPKDVFKRARVWTYFLMIPIVSAAILMFLGGFVSFLNVYNNAPATEIFNYNIVAEFLFYESKSVNVITALSLISAAIAIYPLGYIVFKKQPKRLKSFAPNILLGLLNILIAIVPLFVTESGSNYEVSLFVSSSNNENDLRAVIIIITTLTLLLYRFWYLFRVKKSLFSTLCKYSKRLVFGFGLVGIVIFVGFIFKPNWLTIKAQQVLTYQVCSHGVSYPERTEDKTTIYDKIVLSQSNLDGYCPIDTTDYYLLHPDEYQKRINNSKRFKDIGPFNKNVKVEIILPNGQPYDPNQDYYESERFYFPRFGSN